MSIKYNPDTPRDLAGLVPGDVIQVVPEAPPAYAGHVAVVTQVDGAGVWCRLFDPQAKRDVEAHFEFGEIALVGRAAWAKQGDDWVETPMPIPLHGSITTFTTHVERDEAKYYRLAVWVTAPSEVVDPYDLMNQPCTVTVKTDAYRRALREVTQK